jgi:glycosyltransferase involved in cell wall biosynthesis
MRILHLTTFYPPIVHGGAERSVAVLAEEQARRGCDVGVVTLTPSPESPREQNGVLVYGIGHASLFWIDNWPKHSVLVRNLNKILENWNPVINRRVSAVIKSFRPDIVHSHSMVGFATSAWNVAARQNIPIVHTLRDFNLFCRNSNAFRNGRNCTGICLACRITEPKRWFSRQISAVVGVSRDTLQRHLDRGLFNHVPPERRWVVWNTASAAGTARTPRTHDVPFTIGFIGRILPDKGITNLLDAVAGLPPKGWRLLVAGGVSPPLDPMALRTRTAGLPVDWLGVTPAAKFFAQIDLLVVPSIWAEPFGRVILEAFSCYVPVIGSNIGGIGEAIEQGVTGWLYEPDDVAALRTILAERIRAGRGALPKRAAFARVLSETSLNRVVEKYDTVYRGVLGDRSPRA